MKIIIFTLFLFSSLFLANASSNHEVPFFSYDVGLASGSKNSKSYLEVHFGLNYHFVELFTFRNSLFYRSSNDMDNILGLDTSMRFNPYFKINEDMSAKCYIGSGIRFQTKGNQVPFGEGGFSFRIKNFSVGLGMQILLYSLVDKDAENEQIISLLFAGGGTF